MYIKNLVRGRILGYQTVRTQGSSHQNIRPRLTNECCKLFQRSKTTFKSSCHCQSSLKICSFPTFEAHISLPQWGIYGLETYKFERWILFKEFNQSDTLAKSLTATRLGTAQVNFSWLGSTLGSVYAYLENKQFFITHSI